MNKTHRTQQSSTPSAATSQSSSALDYNQQAYGNQFMLQSLGLGAEEKCWEPGVGSAPAVQSREWFEEQQRQGRFSDITPEMFFQEFLAKNLAYKDPTVMPGELLYDPANGMGYSDYDVQMLEGWGYAATPGDYIANESTGLRATRFDPLDPASGLNSQIAFRGTADVGGIRSDTGIEIGGDQYRGNAEDIENMFYDGYGDIGVSGHSLGGAVASIAAAHNTEHAGSVTTFQGAGIDMITSLMFQYGNAQRDTPIDVNHFQVASDTVHKAGETQLPGEHHETTILDFDHLGELIFGGDMVEDAHKSHTGFFNYRPEMDPTSEQHSLASLYGEENLGTSTGEDPTSFSSRHIHEGGRQMWGSVANPAMDIWETGTNTWDDIEEAYHNGEGGWSTAGDVTLEALEGVVDLGLDSLEASVTAPAQMAKGTGNVMLGVGAMGLEGLAWAKDAAVDEVSETTDSITDSISSIVDLLAE